MDCRRRAQHLSMRSFISVRGDVREPPSRAFRLFLSFFFRPCFFTGRSTSTYFCGVDVSIFGRVARILWVSPCGVRTVCIWWRGTMGSGLDHHPSFLASLRE